MADSTVPSVSTSPEELNDGLPVGTLDFSGATEAVDGLVEDDRAGRYQNLDSLLLWKDGKLIFEMYNRDGRVDRPHVTMSVTKAVTSAILGRAIQLGLMRVDELDVPIVDLMPEIDSSRIQPGVATITMRDALMMKSGLRFSDSNIHNTLGSENPRQRYFQLLFQHTAAVTHESKKYQYTGIDPSIVMMIIDIRSRKKLNGLPVQQFIANEFSSKIGASYQWNDQACGIPRCGTGSEFTSRSLVKIGASIIQRGHFGGEQFLSADYIEQMLSPKKPQGLYYYFHHRRKMVDKQFLRLVSGIGAGGQYMAMFPDQNVVLVATANNFNALGLSLQAGLDHLLPLFVAEDI